MKVAEVYLIIDRYEDYSTKVVTRTTRGKEASRHHQLSQSMHMSPWKWDWVWLPTTKYSSLMSSWKLASINHKLVVTGRYLIPVERSRGVSIHRDDFRNTQEDADVITIHRMLFIVESSMNDININVISDDTDVYWCNKLCRCTFAMEDSLPVTCHDM